MVFPGPEEKEHGQAEEEEDEQGEKGPTRALMASCWLS